MVPQDRNQSHKIKGIIKKSKKFGTSNGREKENNLKCYF